MIGVLPGRSKDTILITSHHDSVFTGAVEGGSGTAEVLALAKVDRPALARVARTFATVVERLEETPSRKILQPGSVPPAAP